MATKKKAVKKVTTRRKRSVPSDAPCANPYSSAGTGAPVAEPMCVGGPEQSEISKLADKVEVHQAYIRRISQTVDTRREAVYELEQQIEKLAVQLREARRELDESQRVLNNEKTALTFVCLDLSRATNAINPSEYGDVAMAGTDPWPNGTNKARR